MKGSRAAIGCLAEILKMRKGQGCVNIAVEVQSRTREQSVRCAKKEGSAMYLGIKACAPSDTNQRFFVAPKVHKLIVNMQRDFDETGTQSPSRLPVVQEPGICWTLTAPVPRAGTADRRKPNRNGFGSSTRTEGIDDRPGDANDVDRVKYANAYSRRTSLACRTWATVPWKFIDSPAVRDWNNGMWSEKQLLVNYTLDPHSKLTTKQ